MKYDILIPILFIVVVISVLGYLLANTDNWNNQAKTDRIKAIETCMQKTNNDQDYCLNLNIKF